MATITLSNMITDDLELLTRYARHIDGWVRENPEEAGNWLKERRPKDD